jgi:hypothetical protein
LAYDEKATAKPSRIWQENDIIEFNAMVRANYTAVSRAALGALSASQGEERRHLNQPHQSILMKGDND